jgi:hypothetical protein
VGLSPVEVAEVDFSIPVQWYGTNSKKITVLELYSPQVKSGDMYLKCIKHTYIPIIILCNKCDYSIWEYSIHMK